MLFGVILDRLTEYDSESVPRLAVIEPNPEVFLAKALFGCTLEFNVPELGVDGPATIIDVRPCPTLEPDDGTGRRLVTSIFRHTAATVIDLEITNADSPIGTTASHPFWSEDRQTFVPAGELRIGEHLRSANRTHVQVSHITPRRGPPVPVYNFEVDGQHVYSVGADGLLVHNSCKFGSAEFGQMMHDKFGVFLKEFTGKIPKDIRTDIGRTGVDASYKYMVQLRDQMGRFAGSFTHAELKPESMSGLATFMSQMRSWKANGMPGSVGLFLYDPTGIIRYVGSFK